MIEVLPEDNLNEFLLTALLYFNIQTKAACKFFKWMDKPTYARGVEVLHEIQRRLMKWRMEMVPWWQGLKTLRMKMRVAWKGLGNCRRGMINTWKSSTV
jgi:hypothetical protein